MMDEKKALFVILSRVLDYPDQSFFDEQNAVFTFIDGYIPKPKMRKNVLDRIIKPLYSIPLGELQEHYVGTFDYKDETNLYLTSHELGDSRKRGAALIQLQRLIHECGYESAGKELADYIPMLLELMAVLPNETAYSFLEKRMSFAIQRIFSNLPETSVYRGAVELLTMYVFEKTEPEEISKLEKLREQADLDELPYPLMYR